MERLKEDCTVWLRQKLDDGMAASEYDEDKLNEDLHFVQEAADKINNEQEVKSMLESIFRATLLEIVTKNNKDKRAKVEKLIDLSIALSQIDKLSSGNPVVLIMDLFDTQTLDECEQWFDLIEDRVSIFKEETFFKTCRNNLLRSCNDLLRRLSKSQNTVFCGRILVFLAKFFPLFERSGLNVMSEFNQDNVIRIQPPPDPLNETATSNESLMDLDLDEGLLGSSSKSHGVQFDYTLYRRFWELQDYFRKPLDNCYNQVKFKTFQSNTEDVLKAFSTFKLYDPSSRSSSKSKTNSSAGSRVPTPNLVQNHLSAASSTGDESDSHNASYFAKYLTSHKLLELEMSDPNFRLYIYIQFLILFHYLKDNIKVKPDGVLLNDDQQKWIKESIDAIYNLIAETTPNGEALKKVIRRILTREKLWSQWKADGCQELKEVNEAANIRSTYQRKRKIGEELATAEATGQVLVGTPEMNRLWNLNPDNWAACRSKDRIFVPQLNKFFRPLINKRNAAKKKVEEGGKSKLPEAMTWRGLRLLAQKSNNFFTPSNQMVKKLDEYLDGVMDKLEKEHPIPAPKTDQPPSNNVKANGIKNGPLDDGGYENKDASSQSPASSTPNTLSTMSNTQPLDETEDISDDELLKAESDAPKRELSGESNGPGATSSPFNVDKFSEQIKDSWKKVAEHLGFAEDEIQYFHDDVAGNAQLAAKKMITVWLEEQRAGEKGQKKTPMDKIVAALEKAQVKVDFN